MGLNNWVAVVSGLLGLAGGSWFGQPQISVDSALIIFLCGNIASLELAKITGRQFVLGEHGTLNLPTTKSRLGAKFSQSGLGRKESTRLA